MAYFPFFVNTSKLKGVIIGGGRIANEKVERLMSFDAELTVVAASICPDIKKYGDRVKLVEREYQECDLDGADYVIAATNIQELNVRVYDDARKRGLLVNVVDVPDKCDFIFPSVLQRGRLVVGVSTSGAGPQIAINLRKKIEKLVPDNIEETLDFLAEERIRAKRDIPDLAERRRYLIELADRLFNYEE